MSRSLWPWLLVATAIACLCASTSTTGWLAVCGALGCVLSIVFLWIILAGQGDDLLDDVIAEAGDGDADWTGDD